MKASRLEGGTNQSREPGETGQRAGKCETTRHGEGEKWDSGPSDSHSGDGGRGNGAQTGDKLNEKMKSREEVGEGIVIVAQSGEVARYRIWRAKPKEAAHRSRFYGPTQKFQGKIAAETGGVRRRFKPPFS